MAITNSELMLMYRAEHGIPESVELYTFGAWKAKGYMVKKGEKASHKVPFGNTLIRWKKWTGKRSSVVFA